MSNSYYYLTNNGLRTIKIGGICSSNFYSTGDSVMLIGVNIMPNLSVSSGSCILYYDAELRMSGNTVTGNFINYGRARITRQIYSSSYTYNYVMCNVQLPGSTGLDSLTTESYGHQTLPLFTNCVENYWRFLPQPYTEVTAQLITFYYSDDILNGNDETTLDVYRSIDGQSDWVKVSTPQNITRNTSSNYVSVSNIPAMGYYILASNSQAPVSQYPVNGTINLDHIVSFGWKGFNPALLEWGNETGKSKKEQTKNPSSGFNPEFSTLFYQLQVSTDSVFNSLAYNNSSITDTFKTVDELLYNTEYYWRVRALNEVDTSGWSRVWNFSTKEGINLHITALIEGFYNPITQLMISEDTIVVELRNIAPPYNKVDSSSFVMDTLGIGTAKFGLAETGNYYLVVMHRNSIETWSKSGGENLTKGATSAFDFTSDSSKAYENNLVLKGTKWCLYSGDVNKDEIIDAQDMAAIDNDSYNSVTGYVLTDMNGDGVVNSDDMVIVYNNSFSFISVKKPTVGENMKAKKKVRQINNTE